MIMPYYAVPKGLTTEDLGMSYNKEIVTDLLRGKLGYTGVVNSDTGISTGMPWGVETLSVSERYRKAIEAGVDRIGGDSTPEIIVELVRGGALPETAHRRVRAAHPARAVRPGPLREPVREPGGRGPHRAQGGVPAEGGPRAAEVHRPAEERGRDPAAPQGEPDVRGGRRRRGRRAVRLRLDRRPRGRGRLHPARLGGPGRARPGPRARGAVPIDLTLPAETLDHVRAILRQEADGRRAPPRQPAGGPGAGERGLPRSSPRSA